MPKIQTCSSYKTPAKSKTPEVTSKSSADKNIHEFLMEEGHKGYTQNLTICTLQEHQKFGSKMTISIIYDPFICM